MGFRNSLRKPDPLGSLAAVGRLAVEAFGVEKSDSDEERGYRPGRGGTGPGPGVRPYVPRRGSAAGEYGRDCGGVPEGVD